MPTARQVIRYLKTNAIPFDEVRDFRVVKEPDAPPVLEYWDEVKLGTRPSDATLDALEDSIPPPTDDERIDEAFPQTDVARVIFEALFELSNRIIALEGGTAITRPQLRSWLKAKLP